MYKIKRLIAFCIDLLLVSFLTLCLTSVYYMNPYLDEEEEAEKAYNEVLNDYKTLNSEDEIDEFISNLQDKLYDYEHTQIYVHLWYIVFYLGYFVLFAYFTGGQTIGKKMMRLKIVQENGSKVGILGLLKRTITNGSSFFMGMNMIALASLILTTCLSPSRTYVILYMGVLVIFSIIEIINIIVYIKTKNNKCLNDYISHTKVINVQ